MARHRPTQVPTDEIDVPAEAPADRRPPDPARPFTTVLAHDLLGRQLDRLWMLTVQHELHGPLTVIDGHAQLLAESVTDRQDAESLRAIRDAVEAMRQVVADLGTIIEGGPTIWPLATQDIDAGHLLERSVQSLPSIASRTRIQARRPVLVRGDTGRVRQCLLNVLGNADKYAPNGTITATVRQDGEHGIIEITDQGPGVPAAERHLALTPGHRGSTAGDMPGAGLGLYITNTLMTSMGGHLVLSSAPFGGLRVQLRLPLALSLPKTSSAQVKQHARTR